MSYDHEAQKRKNAAHLANPEIGDYWQEMLCPILTVVGLYRDKVIVENHRQAPELQSMTLGEFRERLSYGGKTPGTWADVVPASERKRKSA